MRTLLIRITIAVFCLGALAAGGSIASDLHLLPAPSIGNLATPAWMQGPRKFASKLVPRALRFHGEVFLPCDVTPMTLVDLDVELRLGTPLQCATLERTYTSHSIGENWEATTRLHVAGPAGWATLHVQVYGSMVGGTQQVVLDYDDGTTVRKSLPYTFGVRF